MERLIDLAHICMFLEEVTTSAGHDGQMEVDGNSAIIVGDPQEILGLQPKPHPIWFLLKNLAN